MLSDYSRRIRNSENNCLIRIQSTKELMSPLYLREVETTNPSTITTAQLSSFGTSALQVKSASGPARASYCDLIRRLCILQTSSVADRLAGLRYGWRFKLMTTIAIASTDQHLEEILALQRRFHTRSLSAEVQSIEGFVYAEHTLPLLRRMAAQSPQAIALSEGHVVGYCLSLPFSLQAEVPALVPMFEQFRRCVYRGQPLLDYRLVVGGQVCVDREHRGQGLLARLYEQIRVSVGRGCDLCVTEIATRNQVSVRAHERMGFEIINTYNDAGEKWVIVAWDLSRPAILERSVTSTS